ncbi:MAG: methylglyoxal reductase (NADPH-dependent) gre2 [Pycnora praestabilis]|nr:MAG: methylglyoxal reductase (NADPH-dependent) gre2 [Pycnora praestabilis]
METVKDAAQQAVSAVTSVTDSSHVGETVLITGASGFVAAHVLNSFLEHGYNVRGTVRSEQTAEKVRKTHSQFGDKLSFAIVKDVAAPGALDEAVKGVDGVIHTASPFQTSVEDNMKDLIDPAVKGTTSVLEAVATHNPKVKRIVITSSFAAIFNASKGLWPEHTYTEEEWNPVTMEEAKDGNGGVAYMASKTFAEKAAFDFVEKKHPNFTISTICPPMIYGPNAHSVSNLDNLNTSSADIYRLMNGSEKTVPDTSFFAFADVRDVGEAHRLAYESPEAAMQRYFITSGNYTYQQVCDVIRKEVPEVKGRTPEGTPGAPLPEVYKVSNAKATKQLGMHFRTLKETMKDTAESLIQLEKQTGKRD